MDTLSSQLLGCQKTISIEYALEPALSADEFIDVLQRSTLAERRPVGDLATIQGMLRGATIIVTARKAGQLVGVARAISDAAYCTYLADLAVDERWQRRGIGRELVRRTHTAAGLGTKLILLAAPQAQAYYPHIGLKKHDSCWVTDSQSLASPPSPPTPSASLKAVGSFFDSMASQYAAAILRCFPRYPEMLWAVLEYLPPLPPHPRILELGCGTGNLSVLLAERFPDSRFTFVDLSSESLETCKARVGDSRQYTFESRDMRELEYAQGQFDLIASTIAIHHLTSSEKQRLFKRCHGWLAQGGAIHFADQFAATSQELNQRHVENWKRISFEAGGSQEEWDMWMEHQRLHDHHDTLAQQLAWLNEAGFQQLDCPWRYLLWTVLQARKP